LVETSWKKYITAVSLAIFYNEVLWNDPHGDKRDADLEAEARARFNAGMDAFDRGQREEILRQNAADFARYSATCSIYGWGGGSNGGSADLLGLLWNMTADGADVQYTASAIQFANSLVYPGGYWAHDAYQTTYVENGVLTVEAGVMSYVVQQDVSPVQFLEFIKLYFRKEIGGIKRETALNWEIGGNLGDGISGRTIPQEDGSILIQISGHAFLNVKDLYLTVQHELVHASDLTNGNYQKWINEVEQDGWTKEYVKTLMHAIMEYHAYSIEVKNSINFGVDPTAAVSRMESAQRQIEDWGYLSFFDK
jgi:hypothetical protein